LSNLKEILSAREERSLLRKQANAEGKAAVSLNLNIPGIPKTDVFYTSFFDLCKDQLKNWLLANRIFIDEAKEITVNHAAGDFYIVPLQSAAVNIARLKQITEQFEQNHAFGRFIDVDVVDENGQLFSSGKSKLCFYCHSHSAFDCTRSKRHSVEELRNFQKKEILAFLKEERLKFLSGKICSMAIRSILYELSLSPKPGLVDKNGSGIHTDMDFKSFIDSTATISTYFAELFEKGAECNLQDLNTALPQIRNTGLRMEKEMFRQTNGTNTQKGIIFLMGISLFSTGYLLKKSNKFDQEEFVLTIKTLCNNLVENEFGNKTFPPTHGELCFKKYHTGGIRYEAENGFPTIFEHSLPVLENENKTSDISLYKTLLSIMAVLTDTNILYRSDLQTLEQLQKMSKKALADYSMEAYLEIIDFCKLRKISPGGSADLLSITLFIFLMKTEL
jgi:holo-ACP synthase / triphosphoribosyl-dephospho-CoA synthase